MKGSPVSCGSGSIFFTIKLFVVLAKGFRSFFLLFLGLMILGRQATAVDESLGTFGLPAPPQTTTELLFSLVFRCIGPFDLYPLLLQSEYASIGAEFGCNGLS